MIKKIPAVISLNYLERLVSEQELKEKEKLKENQEEQTKKKPRTMDDFIIFNNKSNNDK